MLPGEIEPFAYHHIQALEEVNALLTTIKNLLDYDPDALTVSKEELVAAENKVQSARNGFVRFRICMADEVKQKNRYREYAKEHGYPYS